LIVGVSAPSGVEVGCSYYSDYGTENFGVAAFWKY
jgi:hypothetical protein